MHASQYINNMYKMYNERETITYIHVLTKLNEIMQVKEMENGTNFRYKP